MDKLNDQMKRKVREETEQLRFEVRCATIHLLAMVLASARKIKIMSKMIINILDRVNSEDNHLLRVLGGKIFPVPALWNPESQTPIFTEEDYRNYLAEDHDHFVWEDPEVPEHYSFIGISPGTRMSSSTLDHFYYDDWSERIGTEQELTLTVNGKTFHLWFYLWISDEDYQYMMEEESGEKFLAHGMYLGPIVAPVDK
jgi:hypothetical protein